MKFGTTLTFATVAVAVAALTAIGYWLLAIGYWLLAIGYWLLAIGYSLNRVRFNSQLSTTSKE